MCVCVSIDVAGTDRMLSEVLHNTSSVKYYAIVCGVCKCSFTAVCF